jgi:hypothetical protein
MASALSKGRPKLAPGRHLVAVHPGEVRVQPHPSAAPVRLPAAPPALPSPPRVRPCASSSRAGIGRPRSPGSGSRSCAARLPAGLRPAPGSGSARRRGGRGAGRSRRPRSCRWSRTPPRLGNGPIGLPGRRGVDGRERQLLEAARLHEFRPRRVRDDAVDVVREPEVQAGAREALGVPGEVGDASPGGCCHQNERCEYCHSPKSIGLVDGFAHSSNRLLAILSSSRIGSWVAPAATRGRSAAAATGTIAAREIRKIESFLAAA